MNPGGSASPNDGAYRALRVRPCTAHIGAEVEGIDLAKPLSASERDEVTKALTDHLVLFFRDQNLDFESHLALGRQFGELALHTGVAGIKGHPEIVPIYSDENTKAVAGENWHSDLSFNAEPPMGSILFLKTVPDVGGDTVFADMYAAYEALSPRMKLYLEGASAVHDGEHVYRPYTSDKTKTFPRSVHSVVRTHPVSRRKYLFVNPTYTTEIAGVPKEESRAVLGYLFLHCTNPNFQVRFRWTPRAVAFWDNRCTQHMAIWDYFPQKRVGYRVTIAGDKQGQGTASTA